METNRSCFMGLEALEGRQFMSATPANDTASAPEVTAAATVGASPHRTHTLHHKHHLHALHRLSHLHVLTRQHLHRAHLHHRHHLHTLHVQHVLNTTEPAPLILTAQEKNDWPAIRDAVLQNRKRV